jgi:hypothetical protein
MADDNLDYLLPEQRQWWIANAEMPPTLVLRCGIGGCGICVGIVKSDKADPSVAIALMHHKSGETTVPHYRPIDIERLAALGLPAATELYDANGATLAEHIQRRQREVDSLTIRSVDETQRVSKRHADPSIAMPLEWIANIVCPRHGTLALPNPATTIAAMRGQLTAATHAKRRPLRVFPVPSA